MLRFKGEIRLIKQNNLILVEKIKLDSENQYHYFTNNCRLICLHLVKFRKINFKKFKTLKFNLSASEFKIYFDKRYRFNNIDLIPELKYENQPLSETDTKLYEIHLNNCEHCQYVHKPKSIRKRKKLNIQDKMKLASYIGGNQLNKSIMRSLDISKQTVNIYKRKLNESYTEEKKVKTNHHSSVTSIDQKKILDHNINHPFDYPTKIKRELKLNCSRDTVRNVLAKSDVKSYLAKEEPLVNSNQFNLKKRWCQITKNLKPNEWNQIIFTDEKTLQNFHNGKVKVYRKRGEQSAKHIYRRTLNRFKINLFGYITSKGLGNLYVFDDVLNSEKYINYLHYTVLPDVIEDFGPKFIWQQDGAGPHVSKIALDYFRKIKANLLIWPPASPELNIIENVWARLQKEVNQIIFTEGLPSTKEDLIEYAFRAWYSIGDNFVIGLYETLPSRVLKFN